MCDYIGNFTLAHVSKEGTAQCDNCHVTFKSSQTLTLQTLAEEFGSAMKETKSPIKYRIGMFAIFAFVISGALLYLFWPDKTEVYLGSPQVNDVYHYKVIYSEYDRQYSTMRIAEISNSIYFNPNIYETDKIYGTDDIDKSNNYDSAKWGYTKEKLEKLFEDGDVFEISRGWFD